MPLFEKARIEVFLPDLPAPAYRDLLEAYEREFTYAFGGCTIIRGLQGSYLSHGGVVMQDRINLIFTDSQFSVRDQIDLLSQYADQLRTAAFHALSEEAILVSIGSVWHSAAQL